MFYSEAAGTRLFSWDGPWCWGGGGGGRTTIYMIKILVFRAVFFYFCLYCVVYQLCLQILYVVLEQFETGVSILFS